MVLVLGSIEGSYGKRSRTESMVYISDRQEVKLFLFAEYVHYIYAVIYMTNDLTFWFFYV